MVSTERARALALGLDGAVEQDHHGFPSFRVRGRIFATLPDPGHLHVMLAEDATRAAVRADPESSAECWWGKKLAGVRVSLDHIGEEALLALLRDAWTRVATRRTGRRNLPPL